jgi:GrpB-like predicted nucleotidyltransferase (UPF0157 family)
MCLGLKHGVNTLVDYDARWEAAFCEEEARIREVLCQVVNGMEHYGSTAVPGMRAKPILDILLGVDPLDEWKRCKAPLEHLGYDFAAHAGVPGHYVFGRGRDLSERTHLVHVVLYRGDSWRSNLAFRDALRSDPGLRAEYIKLKEEAIAAAPEDRGRYNELKAAFVERVKKKLAKDGSE